MADMMVKSGIELTVPAAKKHLVAARKAAECLTTDNAAVIVEVSADDPKMVITMFPMKRARPTDVVDRIMRTMAMDMEDYSDQWVAFPKTEAEALRHQRKLERAKERRRERREAKTQR